MLGPIVNAVTIVICSLFGILLSRTFGKNIPDRFQETIMKGLGLTVIYIGISGALQSKESLIMILSVVLGAVVGEALNIDKGMRWLGDWTEKKLGFSGGGFTKGFVSATIIFCTGSMAIVGSMESGLMGDNQMLFAKSILDGTICIVFAYRLGIGVAFSAVPVLIYQGGIALIAMSAAGFIPDAIIVEMAATGSIVVAAIGFNFLELKEIRVANLIPAVFMPWLLMSIQSLF
jgi:uncharacterized protein